MSTLCPIMSVYTYYTGVAFACWNYVELCLHYVALCRIMSVYTYIIQALLCLLELCIIMSNYAKFCYYFVVKMHTWEEGIISWIMLNYVELCKNARRHNTT